jgi:hypothetical protein
MAECGNCDNKTAYRWKVTYGKYGRREECDRCGNVGTTWQPDVYFPGIHKDPNIVDNMGNEILIESKQHKATLMRERGMREANDRVHGGPGHRFDKR